MKVAHAGINETGVRKAEESERSSVEYAFA